MSHDEPTHPELSIVLVTDTAPRLGKVLRYYRAQTDPRRLEIVVAALGGATIAPETITALGFPHVRVVARADRDIGHAEELAVRAATAPFVLFAQTHGYPEPGCVDTLLAATRTGSWTIVGPAMVNANPQSVVSWAAQCIHYGCWSRQSPRGPTTSTPGHHSIYERRALLALGDELASHLDAGASLQTALRARGGTLFLEPAAGLAILNISRLGSYLSDQFLQAVKFAQQRRVHWSWAHRLLYLLGAPLIPLVRLARIVADLRRDGRLRELWRGLPLLLAGLTVSTAGECLGYATDIATAPRRVDTALDRLRYLRAEDRQHELDERTWPGNAPGTASA